MKFSFGHVIIYVVIFFIYYFSIYTLSLLINYTLYLSIYTLSQIHINKYVCVHVHAYIFTRAHTRNQKKKKRVAKSGRREECRKTTKRLVLLHPALH